MVIIHDVKEKPILQVCSQKPSTSSKYGLQRQEVLDTLLFMLESWILAQKLRITYDEYPWHQGWPHPHTVMILEVKDDPILQVSSQEPSMSSNAKMWKWKNVKIKKCDNVNILKGENVIWYCDNVNIWRFENVKTNFWIVNISRLMCTMCACLPTIADHRTFHTLLPTFELVLDYL